MRQVKEDPGVKFPGSLSMGTELIAAQGPNGGSPGLQHQRPGKRVQSARLQLISLHPRSLCGRKTLLNVHCVGNQAAQRSMRQGCLSNRPDPAHRGKRHAGNRPDAAHRGRGHARNGRPQHTGAKRHAGSRPDAAHRGRGPCAQRGRPSTNGQNATLAARGPARLCE